MKYIVISVTLIALAVIWYHKPDAQPKTRIEIQRDSLMVETYQLREAIILRDNAAKALLTAKDWHLFKQMSHQAELGFTAFAADAHGEMLAYGDSLVYTR